MAQHDWKLEYPGNDEVVYRCQKCGRVKFYPSVLTASGCDESLVKPATSTEEGK